MMITFKTVEDYIEVIAGKLDPVTRKNTASWLSEPIISLARYDTDVVEKMADQSLQNIGYTEKQAKLAQKIVLTYKRQLAQKNIDVTPVEEPVFRNPIRPMDYSCKLYIEDDTFCVKFPYNQKLIDTFRSFSKDSQGSCKWDPNKKFWRVDITEYNLNWLYTFAELNKFEITDEIANLMRSLQSIEEEGYAIELAIEDGNIVLRNAPNSLHEYVITNVGELNFENLLKLVDYAPILGYTVDKSLEEALAQEYGYRMYNLLSNRELRLDPSSMLATDNFTSVLEYAMSTDRLPVYIYEPDLTSKLLSKAKEIFTDEEIVEIKGKTSTADITPKTKIVHIVKPLKGHKVPLLVSTAGMIYGGEKEYMVQDSEKIVYCAAEVYNKRQTHVKGIKTIGS